MDKDRKNKGLGEKFKSVFQKEKFMHFLDRQGFYVVLFICICVIGVTALITVRGRDIQHEDREDIVQFDEEDLMDDLYSDLHTQENSDTEDIDEEAEKTDTDDIEIEVEDILKDDQDEDEPQKNDTEDERDVVDESPQNKNREDSLEDKDSEEEAVDVSAPGDIKDIKMVKPVQGDQILCDYAQDELVYSSTLKEWRTHPGIDIECSLGSEVRAALDGTVESVEEDPLMGITITLDHGNDIYTRYANLSTKDMVQVGQRVKEGQVISGVGKTATAEILDAPHLHFEVMVDDKYVDPKKFFE